MQRPLREYQSDLIQGARAEISKGFRAVMLQLVTGGGKTRMVADITHSAIKKYVPGTAEKQSIWFIVPRKELLWQSSAEFQAWGIPHGMITAKSNEQSAFNVHICSKDTLVKRIRDKKIRNWPSIIIFDEGHLALKQQLFVKRASPQNTLFLGFTATPERLDGLGLNEMYDSIIYGPDLHWMCNNGFLKFPKVYSIPPIQGIDELKRNRTGEVNAKELTELYKKRAQGQKMVYGNEIEHYRKYGSGRAFLVFCRSIIDSEAIAEEFKKSGFRVEPIDGTMTDRKRQDKINRVKRGELDGLTTVDLVTYGLDVPRISCIIMLRPTDSVALFFQMIGRGLRPDPDFNDCLIFDHVGNCDEKNHGHPLAPRQWNFAGVERRKRPKDAIKRLDSVDKCPICWDLIINGVCRSCGYEQEVNRREPLKQVDGWLVPIQGPTKLNERLQENRREYEDMINSNIEALRRDWFPRDNYKGGVINDQAVKNLVDACKDIKRQPFWIYHAARLTEKNEVNFSLLMSIQKAAGYKNGWAYYKRKELENRSA